MEQDVADRSVLLQRVRQGDRQAESRFLELVYSELHRIADRLFRLERPGHTLQPTALVSELYIRMLRGAAVDWQSTAHFYRVAATTIRRILVDHARAKNAIRRPNPGDRIQLDDVYIYSEDRAYEAVEISEVLDLLARQDEQQAAIMELRYFAGFTIEETARILGISATTVKAKHEFARAWLQAVLDGTLHPDQ